MSAQGQAARLAAPDSATSESTALGQPPQDKQKEDLFKLDLERLMQVPVAPAASAPALSSQQLVSTVSRQDSTVGHSPAAVFVITSEMIRRSPATSLPELLRMVPGLDVARVDSSRWAISSRGFNSRLSDKMLVQIDGRTIYNPIFSGVFWDVQDLLLQDIERIEVIRGPGATIWGANAVNGIVNIITKRAQDTQGGLAVGGGGSRYQGMSGLRYGGKLGDDLHYRVWGKWSQSGAYFSPDGPGRDDWRQGHGGFRFDWQPSSCDTFTLQGDLFQGDLGRTDIRAAFAPPFSVARVGDDSSTGGDVLWRWRHEVGERSDWTLLAYYDNFDRRITNGLAAFRYNTFDIDFQRQLPLTSRQQVIWGLGYRNIDIDFRGSTYDGAMDVGSAQRQVNYTSAFLQDEFTLIKDRLFFTAGCKILDNDFSGFEYQPTGRLLWAPDDKRSLWAAVSRAVRTPNLLDQDLRGISLPVFPPALMGSPLFSRTSGDRGVISEDLIAYELGYRAQTTESFSWDLALFANVYDNLVNFRPGTPVPGPVPGTFFLPTIRENDLRGEGYGLEFAANWKVTERWRIYGNYSFLSLHLHRAAGLSEAAEVAEGQSPRNQVYLQSSWDLPGHVQVDLCGRYVDNLVGFSSVVPSYITLDAKLSWRPRPNLEFAVIGANLLDANHLEFGTIALVPFPLVEMPRGVYGMVSLSW